MLPTESKQLRLSRGQNFAVGILGVVSRMYQGAWWDLWRWTGAQFAREMYARLAKYVCVYQGFPGRSNTAHFQNADF